MKILQLTAENVKRLAVVEITPKGALVPITGRNGAGKTSVLDAIWWALAGTKHIQAEPIRRGETSARIRLDLGELVVTRKFGTGKASTLTVETAEGARYGSPQKILDQLTGALAFDPLEFSRLEPKRQFDALRRLVQIEVDIDELDALNRGDYEQRTEINRDAKAALSQAQGIAVPSDPGDERDIAALADRMQRAAENNAAVERQRAEQERQRSALAAAEAQLDRDRERLDALRREILLLDEQIAARETEIGRLQQVIAAAAEDVLSMAMEDVSAIRAAIQDAERHNGVVALHRQRRRERDAASARAQDLQLASETITKRMTEREERKRAAIAAAKMPVEGLGFGEGIVTLNGLPLDQASTAEQLRVSLAIAMAANPKLRVIRIKEGSLLDDDGLQLIAEMAQQGDYQVWIERVDTSGKVGVVIEDGRVVADHQQDPSQPQLEM